MPHQLHGFVGRKLSDDGEAGDDIAGCDENAVLRSTRYQPREIVPLDGEALDDAQHVARFERGVAIDS